MVDTTGLETLRRDAGRRAVLTTTVGVALTTTQRVGDGVHGVAADMRAATQPANATGLAVAPQTEFTIADLADGGAAVGMDPTQLTGGQQQHGVVAVDGHQADEAASGASDLPTLASGHLDIVHRQALGDVAQQHRTADVRLTGTGVAGDLGANLEALRSQDVTLLTVGVVDQGDPAVAVGIILDRLDQTFDVELVALEVDDPVLLAMTATTMAAQ